MKVWLLALFLVGVVTYFVHSRRPPRRIRLDRRRRSSAPARPTEDHAPEQRTPSTRQLARWMRNLDRLANQLADGDVVHTYGRQRVEGSIAGREVRVELGRPDAELLQGPGVVVFEVEAEIEQRLDCRRQDGTTDYEVTEGAELAAAANQALKELFRNLGLHQVTASPGLVRGLRRASNRALGLRRLKRVLKVLATVANRLEAQSRSARPLKIRVLHGAEIGSLHIEAGDDTSERICPYCHDVLGSADVVGCEECDTLHHAECLAELGRCATLACTGVRGVAVTRA